MGVMEIAIASLVVASVGGAYSAYTANEAADEQRGQIGAQKLQAAEAAERQKEQTSAQVQSRVEQVKRSAIESEAMQTTVGASAGINLSPGTSFGQIEQQTKRDFGKTLNQTFLAGDQTKSNIDLGLTQTNQQLDFAASQLPSTGQIVGSSALNFGATALNTAGTVVANQARTDLLNRQFSNTAAPAGGNWITGTAPRPAAVTLAGQKLSLL